MAYWSQAAEKATQKTMEVQLPHVLSVPKMKQGWQGSGLPHSQQDHHCCRSQQAGWIGTHSHRMLWSYPAMQMIPQPSLSVDKSMISAFPPQLMGLAHKWFWCCRCSVIHTFSLKQKLEFISAHWLRWYTKFFDACWNNNCLNIMCSWIAIFPKFFFGPLCHPGSRHCTLLCPIFMVLVKFVWNQLVALYTFKLGNWTSACGLYTKKRLAFLVQYNNTLNKPPSTLFGKRNFWMEPYSRGAHLRGRAYSEVSHFLQRLT